jgi:hypothetical protein
VLRQNHAATGSTVSKLFQFNHGASYPLGPVGKQILTSARGATAIPTVDWIVAMLLTAAKQLPESWIDEPLERWFLSRLDTLKGTTVALTG